MDYVLCCTLSGLGNQSTANICRPYSSSNEEYIVTIRKRKISYFILNISMTLLVCRSIALNKMLELCMHIQYINNKSDLIRRLKFRAKMLDITTQQHIGYRKYSQTFINLM